jgi:DNA-binding transcriptional LysR family regulator
MDRLRSMRVFVKVAQRGSFSHVSRELRVSAATVTKMVSALEAELGVRLLERTTRRVELTEAGRFYLDRCQETLQSVDDTDAALSQLQAAPSGTLRVTTPVDFAKDIARVIFHYHETCPNVLVDLRVADHNIDLIEQGFDLGIGLLSPSHASYISRKLCTTRIIACASPNYLAHYGAPRNPTDLARRKHPVFTEPVPRTTWTFRKGKRAASIDLDSAVLTNSGPAHRVLCVRGMGVFIGPSFGIEEELKSGALVPVLTDYELPVFGIHVRYPSRRYLPAKVRSFLESLRYVFGDDPNRDPWLAQ